METKQTNNLSPLQHHEPTEVARIVTGKQIGRAHV